MVKGRVSKAAAVLLAVMMTIALLEYAQLNNVYAISQADAIVSVVLEEEGYTEGTNNDNKYGVWYGNNNVAWCAIFISWCANQAGIPESVIKKNAWAGSMGSEQGTGNFGGPYYPKGSITPQKGDIVYYDWDGGTSDHVEIVISVDESSKTFTSIGGNTKGDAQKTEGVRRHSNYSFTSKYVTGFERPNYNGSANDDELGIGYPRPSGTPYLSTGSTGSGVSWLQSALNKANNAGLTVDGEFGSSTTQAVKNFQAKHGLTQDGKAGVSTINKLVEVIKGQTNISLQMDGWISDGKMGSKVSTMKAGNWYYLCYKIYDKNSSKYLNELIESGLMTNSAGSYSVVETVYNPDGSVFNTCTYDNSDNNWIGIKPTVGGTYKWKVTLKVGKREASREGSFVVSEERMEFTASTTSLSLNLDKNETKSVTFSYKNVPSSIETVTIHFEHADKSVTSLDWGDWSNHAIPLYITGTRLGTEKITVKLLNKNTQEVLAAQTINVTVTGKQTAEITPSRSIVTLDARIARKEGVDFDTAYVTFSCDWNTGETVYIKTIRDGNVCFLDWEEWQSDNTKRLKIRGHSSGTETITFQLCDYATKDSSNPKVLATTSVTVKVLGTCSVGWDPNYEGGEVGYNTWYWGDTFTSTINWGREREGYIFDGWYTAPTGGTKINVGDKVPELDKLTLYAHWTESDQVIHFNSQGGKCSILEKTVTHGDKVGTLPIPTKMGYDFDGWYTEETGGLKVTSDTEVSELLAELPLHYLYAHWKTALCCVTFHVDVENATYTKEMFYQYRFSYGTLEAPTEWGYTKEGYEFDGWYTEETGGSKVTTNTLVMDDQDLYAHWKKIGTSVSLYGDVDCNGVVDIMDAILLNRNLMIGAEISEQGLANADVDNSGSADAVDSLNVLKAVVRLITLPV